MTNVIIIHINNNTFSNHDQSVLLGSTNLVQCSLKLKKSHTVQTLYASDIIFIKFEVWVITLVIWCHQRSRYIRVAKTQGMTKLMS